MNNMRMHRVLFISIFLFKFNLLAALPPHALPISGLKIKTETGWTEYRPASALREQPFEKIWVHPQTQSKRMISTVFQKSSQVCLAEKLNMQKQNFLISELKVNKSNQYLCTFKASLGKQNYYVAIKEVRRKLPKNKKPFISQSLLIQTGGKNHQDFSRWIASVEVIQR